MIEDKVKRLDNVVDEIDDPLCDEKIQIAKSSDFYFH